MLSAKHTYLCGPCIRTGILSCLSMFSAPSQLWYAAPSIVHIVLVLQPGRSLSSFSTSDFQNRLIMLWLEFDYAKAIYRFPRLSTAVSIDTLGVIWNAFTELFEPGAYHLRLLKSLIPIHVSSKFSSTLPAGFCCSSASAHCYLSTRLLSEFAVIAICCTFLYLRPMSLMMLLASAEVTVGRNTESDESESIA